MRAVLPVLMLATLAAGEAAAAPPVMVRVETVMPADTATTLVYSGVVHARTLAELGFRVGGKIVERPVEIGDHVRRGQMLARLDPADLELDLRNAESQAEAAEAEAHIAAQDFSRYARIGRLSPGFLPSEYDRRQSAAAEAAARLAASRQSLAIARDQLSYGTLAADADGVITSLPVEVGQVVAAGQTVATFARGDQTEIWVEIPETRLGDLRRAAIRVAPWADPAHPLAGHIRAIGALADAATRTYTVKIALDAQPPASLALGMTADVTFSQPGPRSVVLPQSALTDAGGAPAVWVLDRATGHAARRNVVVAAYHDDGTAVIARGLAAGETVVTAGADLVDPRMTLASWSGPAR